MSETSLAQTVQNRAGNRCEYCRMHQALQGATFHVEHIVPVSKGGQSTLENLAWCCPSCNLHTSARTDAPDPLIDQAVPLFHPRQDKWSDHFSWTDYELVGRTPTGRATIAALQMNSNRRLLIRQSEERFKLFPP